MKFLTSNIKIQACPNCKHWYGINKKKRFIRKESYWLFRIVCNSCGLKTEESELLDQAKLSWNKVIFTDYEGGTNKAVSPIE